jgi:hypothetical protein
VKDRAREVYLGMSRLFLLVGGVVAVLGLADLLFDLELFRGSPVLTSLFVLAIGGALYWTARTAPPHTEEGAHVEAIDEGDQGRDGHG